MKIVSWNIAGGCKVQSDKLFDYQQEDLSYFIEQLRRIDADVICLQESHTNDQRNLAVDIAERLGGYHVFNSPMSPSHINPDYRLSMAILAKEPFDSTALHEYPDPPFELQFADGRHAVRHAKGLQVVGYQGLHIANTHWLSLMPFGYGYASGEGRQFGDMLVHSMLEHLPDQVILCGDLNVGEFEFDQLLVPLIETLHLQNALPDLPTYHLPGAINPKVTNAPDRIYVSGSDFVVRASEVKPTESDHYLCWADIERR